MAVEAKIPIASSTVPHRFAVRLALFYGAVFGSVGTYLPFFPVWLKAVGIDPSWIGIITAVPSVTRFTILPFITGLAERRRSLRAAMIATAFLTALGFAVVGLLEQPLAIFIAFAFTACVWTPMVPLTDGYALKGVARYGLDYGPLRLWGSAAFVVGALACGLLVEVISARHLIWVIAGMAALGAIASLGLQPLESRRVAHPAQAGVSGLLRDRGFLTIMAATALIQGSHAAYYTVASITWQTSGLGGLTIAGLWSLGVVAEIAVFALSPRFSLPPALLVVLGGLCAVARWLITAQELALPVLASIQPMHGLTFGLTQVGTMGLLVRHVPGHLTARAQGTMTACTGIVMSSAAVLSGAIYARYGQSVYLAMAALACGGAAIMWFGRHRAGTPTAGDQPQSAESGGKTVLPS
ncbi:MFS transporter [Rhodopseudomonas sp. RCAM05734]|uniref:MFS transporter n=1 Tax=Rhodopseudomonas sp. RCAM05734 TaxID=3457549 RepID=UPI004043C9F5